MTGIENAQYDLTDAAFSLSTAIDLLASIDTDSSAHELTEIVRQLESLKSGLDKSCRRLNRLHEREEH
ncbi:hypothetical protein [Thiohalomonas denitrificans]|nr:hypothetical protein [Thiohalomonas denitrificans]